MNLLPIRRRTLGALLAATLLAACATPPATDPTPPIVFVHGNGDSAALWTPTIWRWQSNGWPRARLHAVDFAYPSARDDNTKEQPGRSSTDDQLRQLSAEVDQVLAATGAVKVVLIGNSRGGNAIRHYIANGGGAAPYLTPTSRSRRRMRSPTAIGSKRARMSAPARPEIACLKAWSA